MIKVGFHPLNDSLVYADCDDDVEGKSEKNNDHNLYTDTNRLDAKTDDASMAQRSRRRGSGISESDLCSF